MAQMTLLQIVQDILNDIDGDEVNSIDDTIESAQVAQIVQSTYFALMSGKNWPHLRRLLQLVSSGTTATPTFMTLPEPVNELSFVYYDCQQLADNGRKKFLHIKYRTPQEFVLWTNQRVSTDTNILTVVEPTSSCELLIRNDVAPTYYTSFDDNTIIFDSYDSSIDNTLQQSKTQCYAQVQPTWVATDSAIPNLPVDAFTLLLEEAKSRAAVKLRQLADNKAEQESVRQRAWMSRKDWRVAGGIKFMDYGRRGYKNYRDPTFRRQNDGD
jgi:hypothetical protein